MNIAEKLNNKIKRYKDYPKEGIVFADITTLLADKDSWNLLTSHLKEKYKNDNFDFIVGAESRGFIFAAALGAMLNIPFVPIRKKNKLPGKLVSQEYELEYGTDKLEMKKDAFLGKTDVKVLFMDDLLATGGTSIACVKLLKKVGAKDIKSCFLIDINLGGEDALRHYCDDIYCIIKEK